MSLFRFLEPKATISEEDAARGLRWMTWEGVASMGYGSITTSGFLAAFALALGANNLQIGVLAALPFLAQPLQIPTIVLVEKLRRRKMLAVTTWFVAQSLWVPVALIPVFLDVPSAGAISLLLGLVAVRSMLSAVTSCAWSSWIRDLVPQHILGRFLGRRLALANVAAIAFGLGAAFFVEYWKGGAAAETQVLGYTFPLLLGAVMLGMSTPVFMSLMPEPLMQPPTGPQPSLVSTVITPFRDRNYNHLLRFLFLWGLAINLATPFFAVYMLQRLGLPLTVVIGLSVLSQVFNILFLRVWGPMADRLGSKVVLSVCVSLYLLVVLGWTFTSMPERYFLTIPLLVILHMLAGAAAAGVSLTTGTIGMKLAPQGRATAYLAGAALAINVGSGLGPLLGGRLADFFSVRNLSLGFTWADPSGTFHLPALNLTGFDFLFGITFLLGLVTLNFLAALREEGEAGREVVLETLFAPARDVSRPMSSIPGLNFLAQFPYGYLRRLPIPGLDVALGVTAYQIADAARAATTMAARGRGATARVAGALEGTVSQLWRAGEALAEHGVELARQAARGAIHALQEVPLGAGQIVREVVMGVMRGLRGTQVDPREALRGLGHGIVQGAMESGADLDEAVHQAIEAARSMAPQGGLSEGEAAVWMARGILEAAESQGPAAVDRVKRSMPEELAKAALAEPVDR
jgi:MFS family permease